jgi:hypothetical protein
MVRVRYVYSSWRLGVKLEDGESRCCYVIYGHITTKQQQSAETSTQIKIIANIDCCFHVKLMGGLIMEVFEHD